MNKQANNCETVYELRDIEDAGRVLTDLERKTIDAHVESCDRCSLESRVLEAQGVDGADGPATPLDDLSRRKWVDDTLDYVARHEAKVQAGSGRKWIMGAAAAAVVLVAIAAFLLGRAAPMPAQKQAFEAPVYANVATDYEGEFLLLAGQVETVLTKGKITSGTTIKVGEGQAAVDLDTGVSVFLGPDTEIAIEQMNSKSMEVRLLTGVLTALVNPNRKGPKFQVSTSAGKATVTGTAFSVTSETEDVVLRVFRGSVELDDDKNAPRNVSIGQACAFGSDEIFLITKEEQAVASRLMKTLDMLSSSGSAKASIKSLPAGATVAVDGIVLGKTPLLASVREGHRQLEVSLLGYASILELVELGNETELERVFGLGAVLAKADAGVEPKEKTRPKEKKTAAELLVEAQAHRAKRDWKAAVSTYQELVNRYPSSAQARASYVSLGNILLDHLKRPVKALSLFEKYLSATRKGTLAQEAAYGRTMALKSLGRTSEELFALKIFLADFPSAIQASKVKSRLQEIEERQ